MSGFLLDTNCISEVVSARPELQILEWLDRTDEALLHLSVLTLGEIRKGVAGLAPESGAPNLKAGSIPICQFDSPAGFCRLTGWSQIAGGQSQPRRNEGESLSQVSMLCLQQQLCISI